MVGPIHAQAGATQTGIYLRPTCRCTASSRSTTARLLANEPLVLATVIRTGGSTYAKPGAQMLIAADGEYAGLLSGGCLEGDLREHAREVAASGQARIVSYDLRSTTDQLFGLGAGCEGAMDVLLVRECRLARCDWQPSRGDMAESFRARPRATSWSRSSIASAGLRALSARHVISRQSAPRQRRVPPRSASSCSSPRSRRRRTCCCWAAGPMRAPWPRSPRSSAGASPWSNIAPPISRPSAFRHRRNWSKRAPPTLPPRCGSRSIPPRSS